MIDYGIPPDAYKSFGPDGIIRAWRSSNCFITVAGHRVYVLPSQLLYNPATGMQAVLAPQMCWTGRPTFFLSMPDRSCETECWNARLPDGPFADVAELRLGPPRGRFGNAGFSPIIEMTNTSRCGIGGLYFTNNNPGGPGIAFGARMLRTARDPIGLCIMFPLVVAPVGSGHLPEAVRAFEAELLRILLGQQSVFWCNRGTGQVDAEKLGSFGPYLVSDISSQNPFGVTPAPSNRLKVRYTEDRSYVSNVSCSVILSRPGRGAINVSSKNVDTGSASFTEVFMAVRRARRNQERKDSMKYLTNVTSPAPNLPLVQTLVRDTVSSFTDVAMGRILAGTKAFLKEQVSTSVVVDTNNSKSPAVPRIAIAFDTWYSKTIGDRFQRTFDLVTNRQDDSIDSDNFQPSARVGVVQSFGSTSHTRTLWFPWDGRLYWANVVLSQSGGSTSPDCRFSTIEFCTYGRSKAPLAELLQFFLTYWRDNLEVPQEVVTPDGHRPRARDIQVYRATGGTWHGRHGTPGRLLSSVIIDDEVTTKVVDKITWWQDSKDWYADRGIGYKLTFVFEGTAGCGKTTLSRALATHFLRPIYQINLSQVSNDHELHGLFDSIPAGSIILMEEFDTCTQLLNRELRANAEEFAQKSKELQNTESKTQLNDRITLGAMLDLLDGAVPLTNQIVILTTNKIKDVDPALIRDGRVDEQVKVRPMSSEGIHKYIKRMFPDYIEDPSVVFAERPGSTVQRIYFNHRTSAEDFVQALLQP